MSSANNYRKNVVTIYVGYDTANDKYVAANADGTGVVDVEVIGGSLWFFPEAVEWHIFNKAGHPITIEIKNVQKDSDGDCPVAGGDFSACEFTATTVDVNGELTIDSTLNAQTSPRKYRYDLIAKNASTKVGNAIDPELQIDGLFLSPWLLGILAAAWLSWWVIRRRSHRR